MGVFAMRNAKKILGVSAVALRTYILLHTIGQKRCFWIPGMGVSEMDNAKKCCLGFGVAPQPPVPLYTMGQKVFFWIPGMGLKWTIPKNIIWVLGVLVYYL